MSAKTVTSEFNRIGIPEIHLRNVRREHLPRLYGDFRETVERRIADIKGNHWKSTEFRRFFTYLLSQVSEHEYRQIQLHFLDPKIVEPDRDIVKYLDPLEWFESKLRLAWSLELEKNAQLEFSTSELGLATFLLSRSFTVMT